MNKLLKIIKTENCKGFSIIELLVAMSFFSVVMLSLAYTFLLVEDKNLLNSMRVASQEISQTMTTRLRNTDFDSISDSPSNLPTLDRATTTNLESYCDPDSATYSGETTSIRFRRGSKVFETVYKAFDTVSGFDAGLGNAKTIVMTVCWKHKSKLYFTNTKTVITEEGL